MALQEKPIKDAILRLCGRKGSRYLEYQYNETTCWRCKVGDDVSLDKVKFKKYDTDNRGDWIDKVFLKINDVEYCIGQSYTMGGYSSDNKEEMQCAEENMQLGYLFDEIKDALGCDYDWDAKDIILKNARLIKILDKNGLVDLAKQIDTLKIETAEQSTQITQLQKELAETKLFLVKEKEARQVLVEEISSLNKTYYNFKERLLTTVKSAIDDFKL